MPILPKSGCSQMGPNHKFPISTVFIRHNNISLPIKLILKSDLFLYKKVWKCKINSLCYHSNTNLAPFIDFWTDLCIILLGGIHSERDTIYLTFFLRYYFCWFYVKETSIPINNIQFLIISFHKFCQERSHFSSEGAIFGAHF